jgi:hypothetical protein
MVVMENQFHCLISLLFLPVELALYNPFTCPYPQRIWKTSEADIAVWTRQEVTRIKRAKIPKETSLSVFVSDLMLQAMSPANQIWNGW